MRHRFACGPMLLAALLVGLAAACGRSTAAPTSATVDVVDQLGRTVRLAQTPQRIVSLGPGNTEILFALGLGDRVVGVTEYCDFPEAAKQKPKVGGFSSVDIERLVQVAPDVVFAASIHTKRVLPELERRNLTTIVLAPKTLDELLDAITLVGRATGSAKEADSLAQTMAGRIESVKRLAAETTGRPRVLFAIWHDPLSVAGGDTWHDQLIATAGGDNVFHDLAGYPNVDLETVLRRDPQVIVVNTGMGSAQGLSWQWATTEPRLKDVEARRSGHVYEIDANLVDRPGPRLMDGLEQMLALIHPELAL